LVFLKVIQLVLTEFFLYYFKTIMEIIVKKPTEKETAEMQTQPI